MTGRKRVCALSFSHMSAPLLEVSSRRLGSPVLPGGRSRVIRRSLHRFRLGSGSIGLVSLLRKLFESFADLRNDNCIRDHRRVDALIVNPVREGVFRKSRRRIGFCCSAPGFTAKQIEALVKQLRSRLKMNEEKPVKVRGRLQDVLLEDLNR